MAETLNCYLRKEKGKSAVHKMRRDGQIPAVVYGHKSKNQLLSVPEKEFFKLWQKMAGKQVILDLVIHDSSKESRIQGVLQDYQHELLTNRFLHLDFHKIAAREKLRLTIPIELDGEAPGVKQGGVVDQVLREVEIEALPKDLPEKIVVDINSMNIGDSIYVSNLQLGEGVRILTHANEPIVSVLAPKKVEEETPAAPVTEEVQPEVISEEVAEERRKKKEETKES